MNYCNLFINKMNYLKYLKIPIPEEVVGSLKGYTVLKIGVNCKRNLTEEGYPIPDEPLFRGSIDVYAISGNVPGQSQKKDKIASVVNLSGDNNSDFVAEARILAADPKRLVSIIRNYDSIRM